jgi:prolyl-tRNA synthetase
MALPVVTGQKSEKEKFKGAVDTYSIEAMMQDGKALQAGTSHYLGENFARAFGVQYQDPRRSCGTSMRQLGRSTRLIGALIMAHSDDQGLVLPPELAPVQVVVIPIYKKDEEKRRTLRKCAQVKAALGRDLRVQVDDREGRARDSSSTNGS